MMKVLARLGSAVALLVASYASAIEPRRPSDTDPYYWGNSSGGGSLYGDYYDCEGVIADDGSWCTGGYKDENGSNIMEWFVLCDGGVCTASTKCIDGEELTCTGELRGFASQGGVSCYDNNSNFPTDNDDCD